MAKLVMISEMTVRNLAIPRKCLYNLSSADADYAWCDKRRVKRMQRKLKTDLRRINRPEVQP